MDTKGQKTNTKSTDYFLNTDKNLIQTIKDIISKYYKIVFNVRKKHNNKFCFLLFIIL